MRILRLAALLVIAVAAVAADKPNDSGIQFPPKFDWKTPVRGPDGTYHFMSIPNSAPIRVMDELSKEDFARSLKDGLSGNTCYFIRSYVMKREDDTGATHLDHVTTCTPSSRFATKKVRVRVVPAVQP